MKIKSIPVFANFLILLCGCRTDIFDTVLSYWIDCSTLFYNFATPIATLSAIVGVWFTFKKEREKRSIEFWQSEIKNLNLKVHERRLAFAENEKNESRELRENPEDSTRILQRYNPKNFQNITKQILSEITEVQEKIKKGGFGDEDILEREVDKLRIEVERYLSDMQYVNKWTENDGYSIDPELLPSTKDTIRRYAELNPKFVLEEESTHSS